MKTPLLVKAIEKVVALKMKAVDRIMEDLVKPLDDIGSPEKLIGKPYEKWDKEDFNSLSRIYGTKEPNPLSDFLFNKIYEKVKADESEVV